MLIFRKNVLPSKTGKSIEFDFPEFGKKHTKYWEKTLLLEWDVLQTISDVIINIPYKLDISDFKVGKVNSKEFTVFHPNHDSTHATRQWIISQRLLTSISEMGSNRWRNIAKSFTREENACVRLAAFCLRIGRLNEDSVHLGSQHVLRSAQMFQILATQLGFGLSLLRNIAEAMSKGKPKFIAQERYNGFEGEEDEQKLDKAKLAREVLNMTHRMDLVRCWDSKGTKKYKAIKEPIVKSLHYLLEDAEMAEILSVAYLRFACKLCECTGSKVKVLELDVHAPYQIDLKASCTQSLGDCAEKLLSLNKPKI
tara:strand:- start:15994 stop:16923 length:930 start_codon:yes stop_codon:yes gene_type:complete